MDPHLLHVPRKVVGHKRRAGGDNHAPPARVHSPSARQATLTFQRRHSTPQASTLRLVELRSPQLHPTIRQCYLNSRVTRGTKETSPKLDRVKSPPRPTTLVKPRHPDERATRSPTTPASIGFNTDIFLPVAKKNRTIIIDTPSPGPADSHLTNDGASSSKRQWHKREKAFSLDFGSDAFPPNDDTLSAYTYHTLVARQCKCCYGKCSCRLSYCNFQQCHYSCPLWCWFACVFVAVALLIGMVLLIGLWL